MFLERIERRRLKKNGQPSQRPEVRYKFECDVCHVVYEKRPNNVSVSKSGHHFCSNICKFKAFMHNGIMRDLSEITSLKNFGTKSPMQCESIKLKHKESFKRHGEHVTSSLKVPGAKEKRKRTNLERYGFEETFQIEKFREKRNETWKKNLSRNYISRSELKFLSVLQQHFDKIDHQKWVNKRPIDFYIPSIDTYVQFDGVYWHGLDRPIEEIRESTKPRDIAIYRKWLSDQVQTAWFKEHNLRLVRVTDIQTDEERLSVIFSTSP